MKKYLLLDFEAVVSGEIIMEKGAHEVENDLGSADRWIKRGAKELSKEEYNKIKNVKSSKEPEKKDKDTKNVEPKVETKDTQDNGL
jgi:hypothetical protein